MESEDLSSENNRESDDASGGVSFLQLLCGDHRSGYIKLIATPARTNSRIEQTFSIESIDTVAKFIEGYSVNTSFYFSPATCLGDAATSLNAMLAFCVIFNCVTPTEEKATRRKLEQFTLKPNVIIRSGARLYVLWLLDYRIDLEDQESRTRADRIQQCLTEVLGGDPSTTLDLKIPLPGTAGVALERFKDVSRYDVSDFEDVFAVHDENENDEEPDTATVTSANGKPPSDLAELNIHPVAEAFRRFKAPSSIT